MITSDSWHWKDAMRTLAECFAQCLAGRKRSLIVVLFPL